LTDEERARNIERRLRTEFGYTLEQPSTSPADPLAAFLFERRKGHCEYFASTMAVMLRALDIPARVVTGFQSGVFNPISGWQLIRAADAHSWVEAWMPRRGWTTFDPTPPDTSYSGPGLWARAMLYLDAAEMFWQEWVLNYDLERQLRLASRMEESGRRFRFGWLERTAGFVAINLREVLKQWAPTAVAILAVILIGVFYGPKLRRWWAARRRVQRLQRGQGDAADAAILYQKMLALLHRRGIEKPPWITPWEFTRVLPPSEISPLVEDLTHAYNEMRFGGRREVAPRMIAMLDKLERAG
jgi:hypothetical protein